MVSNNVVFEDYSMTCKAKLKEAAIAFLHEAGDVILAATARNYDSADRVDTGKTKGSFQKVVDEGALSCTMGSSYQNAIWEEFGTGVHALHGDGRKTPWRYKNKTGWHTTRGKTGHRPFFKAYEAKKSAIKAEAERRFSAL